MESPFAGSAIVPPSPPVCVEALWYGGGNIARAIFDRPLSPGVLDPGNWTCRYLNVDYPVTGATALASEVVLTTTGSGANPGPNMIVYGGVPPDVTSTRGVPAAPFFRPLLGG